MIKITENKKEVKQAEVKYPCLMKHNSYNLVVLFKSPSCGTVITGFFDDKVGDYKCNWNEIAFTPINYSITLENDN